jgi:hypothetical protein
MMCHVSVFVSRDLERHFKTERSVLDTWPVHLVWMTARLQQDTFLSWHLAPASEVAGGHTLPF